jgi:hypothetical protein
MGDEPTPEYTHLNTIGEKLTIDRVGDGVYEGRLVLTIHDDPPSKAKAPMLLDQGTQEFLLYAIGHINDFDAIRYLEDHA